MFRETVEVSAERRREEIFVARGVGNDVRSPIIEDASVWIGEIIGGVGFESCGARLKAVDGGVIVPNRPNGCFDLSAMEDAVTEIDCAAGIQAKSVGRVMGIRR